MSPGKDGSVHKSVCSADASRVQIPAPGGEAEQGHLCACDPSAGARGADTGEPLGSLATSLANKPTKSTKPAQYLRLPRP